MRLDIFFDFEDHYIPPHIMFRRLSEPAAQYYGYKWFMLIGLFIGELEIAWTYEKSRVRKVLDFIRDVCWAAWWSLPGEMEGEKANGQQDKNQVGSEH